MKSKAIVFGGLIIGLLGVIGYQQGQVSAAKSGVAPAKIGVLSIDKILKNSKKHEAWKKTMDTEELRIRAEFDKAKSELDLLQADMKTRTKGSEDFMKLNREYNEKKALLEAKDAYYQQEMEQRVKDWTEKLYQDIQKRSEETAKKNGLDMIVSREDIEYPSVSMRDMLLTIRTNKIMFFSPSLDITDEVLAAVDAGN